MCRPLDTFRAHEHNFVFSWGLYWTAYAFVFLSVACTDFFHCFVIFVVLLLQVSRSHQVRCRSSCWRRCTRRRVLIRPACHTWNFTALALPPATHRKLTASLKCSAVAVDPLHCWLDQPSLTWDTQNPRPGSRHSPKSSLLCTITLFPPTYISTNQTRLFQACLTGGWRYDIDNQSRLNPFR